MASTDLPRGSGGAPAQARGGRGAGDPEKRSFHQSMAWLHTWSGLVLGWILFYIFLTGTLSYVRFEIDRWMRPELPLASAEAGVTPHHAASRALAFLSEVAPDAQSWGVRPPSRRTDGQTLVWWTARSGGPDGDVISLDPATGRPGTIQPRDTGGGGHFYEMHFSLHYVPYAWAIRIVGFCAMLMLVGMISGVVIHRRIFRDFFTFRPGKGQRSWLDAHNILGVTALPFHLMITYSGLVFFLFAYMPVAPATIYGSQAGRLEQEAIGAALQPLLPEAKVAAQAQIAPVLDEVDRRWGLQQVEIIAVREPGRANSEIDFKGRSDRAVAIADRSLTFSGVTGALLAGDPGPPSKVTQAHNVLLGLHIGDFAGPWLRALYVLSGLAGSGLIATGLILWTVKRRAKLEGGESLRQGIALVDRLNLGAIIGLPIAIAAYFWANRLLPFDLAERHDWEVHVMFLTWAAMFIYPVWRPLRRASVEMPALAAFAFGFIPILNALTTDRHLAVTLPARDWVLAGFDVIALGIGIIFAFVASRFHLKARAFSVAPATRRAASLSEIE